MKELVLAIREILPEKHHSGADQGVKEARDKVSPAPRGEGTSPGGNEHSAVNERHEELGNTSAEVAPSSSSGVSDSNALAVEHAGHPELTSHESGEAESDAHAANEKARRGGDITHAEAERGGHHQHDGQTVSGSNDIANGPHDHAGGDGASHGREASAAQVRLGEFEVLTNDSNHGSGREGGHEGNEEADPRHVERRVVRAVEREDVQGLGLVFTAESVSRVGVVSLSRRKGSAERRNRSPGVATVVTRDAKR